MALDVSGSQIYAGRYHYRRSEMPDLFREDVVQSRREKKSIKEQYYVDTVTFSEEGMAKAKAKDWRAYTIDNPDISHVNIKEQREELYRQLNTVNKVDTASMFNLAWNWEKWRHRYKRRMEAVNMRARTKHFLRVMVYFCSRKHRKSPMSSIRFLLKKQKMNIMCACSTK